MDLNPQPPADWKSAEGPYELADHCLETNTDVLILLNSWLDSAKLDDGDRIAEEVGDGEEANDSDWDTLNYWAARLWPLWRKQRVASEAKGEDGIEQEEEKYGHETIVVACNRTGEENGMSPYLPQPIVLIST
jgi:protein N-terminal amidase